MKEKIRLVAVRSALITMKWKADLRRTTLAPLLTGPPKNHLEAGIWFIS